MFLVNPNSEGEDLHKHPKYSSDEIENAIKNAIKTAAARQRAYAECLASGPVNRDDAVNKDDADGKIDALVKKRADLLASFREKLELKLKLENLTTLKPAELAKVALEAFPDVKESAPRQLLLAVLNFVEVVTNPASFDGEGRAARSWSFALDSFNCLGKHMKETDLVGERAVWLFCSWFSDALARCVCCRKCATPRTPATSCLGTTLGGQASPRKPTCRSSGASTRESSASTNATTPSLSKSRWTKSSWVRWPATRCALRRKAADALTRRRRIDL